ncbi:DEP domain-containing protein 1B-like, partial [Homarus americanus]
VVPLIPYELYESFIRMYIGAEFLDITYRSPTSSGGASSSSSSGGSYRPDDFNDNDSVDDLMLNMSICGQQQKTSTPNSDNDNIVNGERLDVEASGVFRRQGSSKSLGSGSHTPSVGRNSALNSSKLQSLKLRRLKNYTDFKEDNLYPTLLEGSHEGSCLGLLSENQENIKPLLRQSKSPQEFAMQRQPETVRSVKTNDHARRVRRENDGREVVSESAGVVDNKELDNVELPQNCCFETAFTSDSPKTRIIPQKSVDSLHFKNGDRAKKMPKPRPKSIAAPSLTTCEAAADTTRELRNLSTVSDLFKSSIMSTNTSGEYVTALMHSPMNRSRSAGNLEALNEDGISHSSPESVSAHNINEIVPARSLASRIRDSIKRKHVRDDSASKKRSGRSKDKKERDDGEYQALDHLRTKSGGYMNLALAPVGSNQEDTRSIKSCVSDYRDLGPGLGHLRTKSGGFLNLALMPSNDSVDTVDSTNTFSGPPATHSDAYLPGQRCTSISPLYGYNSKSSAPRTEAVKRRMITPDGCLSHSLSSSSGCSVYHSALSSRSDTPAGPPLPPRNVQPRLHNYENLPDLSKQLSSSANELSDRWADRTPYGQVPPYAEGGVWRHYHSSPSKRLIGRRKGIEFYYGSKACLPGLLTREGKDVAVGSIQLLLLLLAPVRRRKLHLLLRMMSKMSNNDKLSLDQEQSTRALHPPVYEKWTTEVLSLRIVSFLMDNHEEILRPPQDLAVLVHRRLSQIQRSQLAPFILLIYNFPGQNQCLSVSVAVRELQTLLLYHLNHHYLTAIFHTITGGQQHAPVFRCRDCVVPPWRWGRDNHLLPSGLKRVRAPAMIWLSTILTQLLEQIVNNEKLLAKAKKKKLKE